MTDTVLDELHDELGEQLHVGGHAGPPNVEHQGDANLVGPVSHLVRIGIVPQQSLPIGDSMLAIIDGQHRCRPAVGAQRH